MTEDSTSNLIKSNPILMIIIGSIVGAILIVSIVILAQQISPTTEATNSETFTMQFEQDDNYSGITILDSPRPVPDFTLTSHMSESINLSDLYGTFTLMSFGFTNCPDICPLTVVEFGQVHEALLEDDIEMDFLLISVDGERDTPEALQNFFSVRNTDDFMIGLTGDPEDVRRIAIDYGARFVHNEPNANGFYNVDHTAASFLLNEKGEYVAKFDFGTDYREIVNEIKALMATQS